MENRELKLRDTQIAQLQNERLRLTLGGRFKIAWRMASIAVQSRAVQPSELSIASFPGLTRLPRFCYISRVA